MNKKEVQKRVLQFGEQISLKDFEWDEDKKIFSTEEASLILSFGDEDGITFKTGHECTFKTGDECTFNTGSRCTFDTGSYCTFETGDACTFNTGSHCTFDTGYACTFDTGKECTFKTGSYCTFETGDKCTFKTGNESNFDTGSRCTFDTGSYCTFETGKECIVIRRDVYEVIELEEDKTTKLNDWGKKGYTVVNNEMIEIDGKKYSESTIAEALKEYTK